MISINPATKVIYIPKSYLTFVSGILYELDTNTFRLDLKNLEDSSEMIAFERTHKHNTEVTILGTTFARVIEIINSYKIEFEDGEYTVKLVGSNNNFFDSSVLIRNLVQVVSTNSAGLIASAADRKITEDLNYSNGIYLDTSTSYSGTVYPKGTRSYPVNNLADAVVLADRYNIHKILLVGDLTITQPLIGYSIDGDGNSIIDFNNTITTGTSFMQCVMTGNQNSNFNMFISCKLTNINNLTGTFINCFFVDTTPLILKGNSSLMFTDCRSAIAGAGSAVFDYSNGGIDMSFRAYSGGISIINSDDVNNVATFEFIAGKFNFDESNTAGYFAVRGVVDDTNINSGGATVALNGAISPNIITDSVWDESTSEHTTAGSTGKALTDSGASGNPWSTPISGNMLPGTFGEKVGKKLLSFSKWIGLK